MNLGTPYILVIFRRLIGFLIGFSLFLKVFKASCRRSSSESSGGSDIIDDDSSESIWVEGFRSILDEIACVQ